MDLATDGWLMRWGAWRLLFRKGGLRNMKATHHLTNERGVALMAVAVIGMALLAATAIGVGVGRHAFTATEVQTVAEVAATAAAQARVALGGTDAAGRAAAFLVVPRNRVDGQVAAIDPGHLNIEFGNFNGANDPPFTPNPPDGTPVNAVRATANASVPNLFPISIPGLFNLKSDADGNYTVTKTAIATYSSVGAAQPTLPIALCSGCFDGECVSNGTCLTLQNAPTGVNDAAWTGFTGSAGTNAIRAFFPSPCGAGVDAPVLNASTDPASPGTSINLLNGSSNLAPDVWCMVCNLDMHQFLVPVIDCECSTPINQSAPVVGFATVTVNGFNYTNGAIGGCTAGKKNQTQSINLQELLNSNVTGPPGGGNFGSGSIFLQG
jgi:hypothetical protein